MRLGAKNVFKGVLAIVGAAISIVLVASVFFRFGWLDGRVTAAQRFDFVTFWRVLPSSIPWLIPFIALTALVLPLRAFQWQTTLDRKVPFRERYHCVAIGAFVHNALPGKFGDLFRAFLLGRTQDIPFVAALGSVAVCKLLEFAALMLLVGLSFLGPFADVMSRFGGAMRVALAICLGLVAGVVLLAHYAQPLSERIKEGGRFTSLRGFLANVSVGLGSARSFRGFFVALLASLPPVSVTALAYGIGLSGVGVKGGLFAGAAVLGAIALGQAAPGLPAGTGIYYFVTSWSARSMGASPEQAAAYAALTHLSTLGSQLILGALSVWLRKLNWKQLRQGAAAAKARSRGQKKEGPEMAGPSCPGEDSNLHGVATTRP